MSIDTLRNVVRDLLPSGPFWLSAAVDSFVHAMAAAVDPLDSFLEGLSTAINPGTAARAVLLDWWEYLRSECSGTPADTEELRARVIEALAAPPVHTFDGLEAIVLANGLEFVELREFPFVSQVPFDVPSPINEHARILDIWNSALLHDPALVLCVLQTFAQAADVLRLRVPSTSYRDKGDTADARAFTWVNAWGTASIEVERNPASGGGNLVSTYALPEEDGAATWADVLGLLDADPVAGDLAKWTLRRDFGAGPVDVTEPAYNLDLQVAAFQDVSGVTPSFLWPGWFTSTEGLDAVVKTPITSTGAGEILHAFGTGIDTASSLTLGYFALRNLTDAFDVDAVDALDVIPTSRLFAFAYQLNGVPGDFRAIASKRESVGDLRGWEFRTTPTDRIEFAVDYDDVIPGDQIQVTILDAATLVGWQVAVILWDVAADMLTMWIHSDAGAEGPASVAIPLGATAPSMVPFTIGKLRLDSPDCDVALAVTAEGSQVEGIDGAALAQALQLAITV